jgi:hypothetical protein
VAKPSRPEQGRPERGLCLSWLALLILETSLREGHLRAAELSLFCQRVRAIAHSMGVTLEPPADSERESGGGSRIVMSLTQGLNISMLDLVSRTPSYLKLQND